MDSSNSSSSNSPDLSEKSLHYTQMSYNPSTAYTANSSELHALVKKIKTDNCSQPCIIKKVNPSSQFVQPPFSNIHPGSIQSSSGPYFPPRRLPYPPQQLQKLNKLNVKNPYQNLEGFMNNQVPVRQFRVVNGKRMHPDLRSPSPRGPVHPDTIRHLQQKILSTKMQLRRAMIQEQMATYKNGGYSIPKPKVHPLHGNVPQPPMQQYLEHQYHSMIQQLQTLQQEQIGNSLASQANWAGFNQLPYYQPKASDASVKSQMPKQSKFEEKTETIDEEKSEQKTSVITKIQPQEKKVFEFSSIKFNLTINYKTNEQEEQENKTPTQAKKEQAVPSKSIVLSHANIPWTSTEQLRSSIAGPTQLSKRSF